MGPGVTLTPGTKGGFRVRVTGALENTSVPLATCLVTTLQRPAEETEGRQSCRQPQGPATFWLVTGGQQLPFLSLKMGSENETLEKLGVLEGGLPPRWGSQLPSGSVPQCTPPG